MSNIDILIESLKYSAIGTLAIVVFIWYILYMQEKAGKKNKEWRKLDD